MSSNFFEDYRDCRIFYDEATNYWTLQDDTQNHRFTSLGDAKRFLDREYRADSKKLMPLKALYVNERTGDAIDVTITRVAKNGRVYYRDERGNVSFGDDWNWGFYPNTDAARASVKKLHVAYKQLQDAERKRLDAREAMSRSRYEKKDILVKIDPKVALEELKK